MSSVTLKRAREDNDGDEAVLSAAHHSSRVKQEVWLVLAALRSHAFMGVCAFASFR